MAHHYVGRREDFKDGSRLLVEVAPGLEIGVLEHDDQLFAYENRCVHQGGPVCEGVTIGLAEEVIDDEGRSRGGRFSETQTSIVCPWHGYEFDLRTGACVADPRLRLRRYEIIEREGRVYVDA